jgi:hypothetical protein
MMNRKYTKMLAVLVLIAALTSCKSFVDFDPHENYRITDLDYLKSETDYRTMVISTYTPIQWLNQ